ncbi:MAG: DUF421 domain-containing protein [Armatimonadetes bacterium]|nr:DUF421 domain-containing protein [Armatimonadota bacterium]
MDDFQTSLSKLLWSPGDDLSPGLVSVRTFIVFVAAIAFVRLAKKRFMAQASAVDVVMAVVLGSLLSRAINGGANLVSCLEAAAVMVLVQRTIERLSYRSPWFCSLVKGTRQSLIKEGVVQFGPMEQHAVTKEDLLADMRLEAQTDDVEAIKEAVLERNGRIGFVRE